MTNGVASYRKEYDQLRSMFDYLHREPARSRVAQVAEMLNMPSLECSQSAKELILDAVENAAWDFYFYDRCQDPDVPRDLLVQSLRDGVITVGEIAERFREKIVRYVELEDEG